MSRSRAYCFTLNNYSAEEVAEVQAWTCQYLIFGKEVGEEGTPHLQGYVYFANAKTLAAVKKLQKRAHFEASRGSAEQNFEYCSKQGEVFEKGAKPMTQAEKGQSEIDAWNQAFEAVKNGNIEEMRADIKCRHLKSVQYAVQQERLMKRKLAIIDGDMEHVWYVGDTGAGKSRKARLEHPGAYIKDPTTTWWDGYVDEDVVIIDDFDKFQVKQGGDMKRWLDRYPFQAQFKGGYATIRPRKIVVTSQYTPKEIWDDQKTVDAIMRRVKVLRVAPPPVADPPSPNRFTSWSERMEDVEDL